VVNLKPARLRGVESQGMLLAAQEGDAVEVLFADHAQPGDPVGLTGLDSPPRPGEQIDIDEFFTVPIQVEDGRVLIDGVALECAGRPVTTARVTRGQVR
jgi:methionyl-tRNA synthetase